MLSTPSSITDHLKNKFGQMFTSLDNQLSTMTDLLDGKSPLDKQEDFTKSESLLDQKKTKMAADNLGSDTLVI